MNESLIYVTFIILNSVLFLLANEWRQTTLDPYGKYNLYWSNNDINKTIIFIAEVQTRGWIGFGLSPNGGMKNSDIIIGWVSDSDGKAFFHDRFAEQETIPQIDESQDWILIDAKQNSTHTIMKFSRSYLTCDHRFDREITKDTNRIIYAFSDSDPESVNQIEKHSIHSRGSKSILLLSDFNPIEPQEMDLKTLIVNVKHIMIPSRPTTYWCKAIKFDKIKRHVVKYEKYLTTGNEPFVHHMALFTCNHPNVDQLEKYLNSEGLDCTDASNMPQDFKHCFNPHFNWAVGGEPVILPISAGFPIGADEETTYMILQIHYENPELISNRMDSSGLKFYYTENLRKYDAYSLTLGSTFDFRLIVPPNLNRIQTTAHCDPKCYEKLMDSNGLNVFAVAPHSHSGKSIRTRHFRGNEELEWILDENNYDFNFQTFRPLKNMIKIMPNDHITTECVFNTSSRNKAIIGGLSTKDEMCITFLYYYPRMKNAKPCLSGLSINSIMALSGVEEVYKFGPNEDPVIKSPHILQNLSLSKYLKEKQDWNQQLIDSQNIIKYSKQHTQCYWIKTDNDQDLNPLLGYPDINHIYEPLKQECKQSVQFFKSGIHTNEESINYSFVLILTLFVTIMALIIVFIIINYLKSRSHDNHVSAYFKLLK